MQPTKLSGQPIICQLLSFLPKELVAESVAKFDSDRYYKTMSTYKQLVFMLYGIVSKSGSLTSLCKCLLFLEGKLGYVGIDRLPATSTLSDANCRRDSNVFQDLYYRLFDHYRTELQGSFSGLPINGEAKVDTIKRFDSTTFTLFVDILKGAGRNPVQGKKKGGVKAQTVLGLDSLVPELIALGPAARNDKDFLGQLTVKTGHLYVFDKGYVNYNVYRDWTEQHVFFVTRLNENATYTVLEDKTVDHFDLATSQGVVADQEVKVKVKGHKMGLKLRLVTYKDPETGKVLKFMTNHFIYGAQTIALIYKNRWAIEPFFKQLKQNYQLGCFFSDSEQGIKTQIWIALIANLIFTLIYQRNKEEEAFVTIVSMTRAGLNTYVCLLTIIKHENLSPEDRDNGIVQLKIFENQQGGVLKTINKSP